MHDYYRHIPVFNSTAIAGNAYLCSIGNLDGASAAYQKKFGLQLIAGSFKKYMGNRRSAFFVDITFDCYSLGRAGVITFQITQRFKRSFVEKPPADGLRT